MTGGVCWSVSWFVNTAAEVISRKVISPIFKKFGTDVQHLRHMSLGQRSRSKFKVKIAVLKIFHLQ